jgi:hypothetical protein
LSIFASLKRAFRGRGRFDPAVGADRIPRTTVRRFSELDTAICRELYELNEPGRFPSGYLDEFLRTLKSSRYLYLVVEVRGKLAAVGGIYRTPELPMRVFDCYRSYLEESDWESCVQILAQRGVHFDRTGVEVPLGPAMPDKSLDG